MNDKANVDRRGLLAGLLAGVAAVWASARGGRRGKRPGAAEVVPPDKKRDPEPPIWIGHL